MNLLRVRELFHRISAQPPAERPRLLEELCAGDAALRREVAALLAAGERAGAFLAEPTLSLEEAATRGEAPEITIGAYRLLEKLGEGGYGEVYLAEQSEPVRRRVALKMLKAGLDSKQVLARFEAERQTLAIMDHPGIAKIFDAGTTPRGRPYFVMEFVDGMPVTEFCLLRKVPPRARLELFCEICRAVQHAHTRGVIHRDLKPSNVIVSEAEGRARAVVIDFGIAKALRGAGEGATLHTGLRQLMGTPAYMSPEQAGIGGPDVDTRSDIYSLGVLLYEMLTGVTPLDASQLQAAALAEVQRRISEEVPPKPSTRVAGLTAARTQSGLRADFAAPVRLLRGDLDWIVMKALEKEPARRYGTAAAFAEDVVRHLGNEPVSAGPPSTLYRLKKWTQRNRAAAIAAGTGLAAVCVAVGGLIHGYVIAQRESAARKVQAERAEALLRLQDRIFRAANPAAGAGGDYRVRQLLDDFSVQFKQSLGVEPDVEISLRQTVGRAYQALGGAAAEKPAAEMEKSGLQLAEDHFRAALVLAEQTHGAESRSAADCRTLLGAVLRDAGRYTEARPLLESALAQQEKLSGAQSVAALTARALLADVCQRLGDKARAFALAKDSLTWPDDAGEDAVTPLHLAASVLLDNGDTTAAADAAERALHIARAMDGGTEGVRCILPLQRLAQIRLRQGRAPEAVPMAAQAAELAEKIYGAPHALTIAARTALTGAKAAAEPGAMVLSERKALFDMLSTSLGATHPESFAGFVDLLRTTLESQPEGAASMMDTMMRAGRQEYAKEFSDGTDEKETFIAKVTAAGNAANLESPARAAVALALEKAGASDRNTLDLQRLHAGILAAQEKWPAAAGVLTGNLETCRASFGANDPRTREARLDLAALWQRAGNNRLRDEMLSGLAEELLALPADAPGRGAQLLWLWELRRKEKRYALALPLGAAALESLAGAASPGRLLFLRYYHANNHFSMARYKAWRLLMQQCMKDAAALHGTGKRTTWVIMGQYADNLSHTNLWRSDLKRVGDWSTAVLRVLTTGDVAFTRMRSAYADLAEKDSKSALLVTQMEEEFKTMRATHEEASPDGIRALLRLARAYFNANRLTDLREAAVRTLKAAESVPESTAPQRDLALMLQTWTDYMTGAISPDAAVQTTTEIMQRLDATNPPDNDTVTTFLRARDVMHDAGRAHEGFALEEAWYDRRANIVWPAAEVQTLVPRGATWHCLLSDNAPDDAWKSELAWNDDAWQRAELPCARSSQNVPASGVLLAGEKPQMRGVQGGTLTGDEGARPYYFRRIFHVPEGKTFRELKLRLRVCDGAAVWLNGQEIAALRMTPERDAADGKGRADGEVFVVPATALKPGPNLLAVAVHPDRQRKDILTFCCDCVLEARE